MTQPHPHLTELHPHWQDHIKHLRQDRAELRRAVEHMKDRLRLADQGLPPSWEKKLRKLRDENVQLRKERNAAREEAAALRAELEARGR